jgi:dihydrolipoamide dehydrogenase
MPEPTATYDLVVIGGGPGGYAAALYGAAAGLGVALVERDKVGGTCLHRGCVPAKEFLETAAVWRSVEHAGDFGVATSAPSLDFAVSQARKASVVEALFKGLSGLLKGRSIAVLSGTGRLHPDHVVEVVDGEDAGTFVRGTSVVLAPGSVPRTLPGLEVDGRLVVTSDEFLDLTALPARAAVVGGGAIGCEFGSMLSDLGTQVTIVEGLDSILAGCDVDVANVVARSFKKRKVAVLTGASVTGHTPSADGTSTTLHVEGGDDLEVDMVVVSVGRRPRTEGLLAEGTGVVVDERGFLEADGLQRTAAPDVYAVGDVVAGSPQLAHVGFAEAIVAVKDILGEPNLPVDYAKVPWAIYCHPEVAWAGMTEAQAVAAGIPVIVKKDPVGGNSRARIIGETEGLVKVIAEQRADGTAGRVLGVHMAGPWVTEQLSGGYLAVNWEATADEVARFVQPHPSLSETFGEAMLALAGRGLHVG